MRKLANIKPNVRMHEKLLMDYHKLWLSTCIESNWAMFFSSAYVCDGRSLSTWGIHCQRNEMFNPLSSSGNPSTSFSSLQTEEISKLISFRMELMCRRPAKIFWGSRLKKSVVLRRRWNDCLSNQGTLFRRYNLEMDIVTFLGLKLKSKVSSTPGHGSVWVNIWFDDSSRTLFLA